MVEDALGILGVLNYLGLTPDKLVPLAFLTLALYIIFHKKLHGHLTPIKHAIVEIQSIMSNAGANIFHSLTERGQSPLNPTEYGMSLINNSGLGNILKDNMDKFLEELHQILIHNMPINSYDVQEKAREFLVNKQSDKIMTNVKNYAFENALSVETILKTGGLLLRDEYLKRHKLAKE